MIVVIFPITIISYSVIPANVILSSYINISPLKFHSFTRVTTAPVSKRNLVFPFLNSLICKFNQPYWLVAPQWLAKFGNRVQVSSLRNLLLLFLSSPFYFLLYPVFGFFRHAFSCFPLSVHLTSNICYRYVLSFYSNCNILQLYFIMLPCPLSFGNKCRSVYLVRHSWLDCVPFSHNMILGDDLTSLNIEDCQMVPWFFFSSGPCYCFLQCSIMLWPQAVQFRNPIWKFCRACFWIVSRIIRFRSLLCPCPSIIDSYNSIDKLLTLKSYCLTSRVSRSNFV